MLQPKRTKFRKQQKGRNRGLAVRGSRVSFGDFGLQALDRGWMSSRQIEACRVAINRYLKRKGKVWIRVFPHKPITARPPETRMGKGKGAVDFWCCKVKPGTTLFEISGADRKTSIRALESTIAKLPIKVTIIG